MVAQNVPPPTDSTAVDSSAVAQNVRSTMDWTAVDSSTVAQNARSTMDWTKTDSSAVAQNVVSTTDSTTAGSTTAPDSAAIAHYVASMIDSTTAGSSGVEEFLSSNDSTSTDSLQVADMKAPTKADSTFATLPNVDPSTYQPQIRPLEPPTVASSIGVRQPDGLSTRGCRRARLPRRHGAQVSTKLAPDFIGAGGGVAFTSGFGFSDREQHRALRHAGRPAPHVRVQSLPGHRPVGFPGRVLVLAKRRADFSFGAYQFSELLRQSRHVGGRSVQRQPDVQRAQLRHLRADECALQQVLPDGDRTCRRTTRIARSTRTSIRRCHPARRRQSKVRLIEPSLAFVHDSAFFGPFGPVEGALAHIAGARRGVRATRTSRAPRATSTGAGYGHDVLAQLDGAAVDRGGQRRRRPARVLSSAVLHAARLRVATDRRHPDVAGELRVSLPVVRLPHLRMAGALGLQQHRRHRLLRRRQHVGGPLAEDLQHHLESIASWTTRRPTWASASTWTSVTSS